VTDAAAGGARFEIETLTGIESGVETDDEPDQQVDQIE